MLEELKKEVCKANLDLVKHGLVIFTWGGGGGYDMNFVLNKKREGVQLAAIMKEPENGIVLEVYTDKPGLQFYSGPCMNGRDKGKRGDILHRYGGVALETQNYPDSPNHENFPNTILRPGEKYVHTGIFKFSVEK